MFAAGALLLSVGLMGSCGEALDDFNSRIACEGYCAKKFDCDNHTPTGAETDTCVSACRDSIEDNCGNEHQAAANDKIDECVDKSCTDFWACMIFEAAPECLGFVN
jgi:hypothetical protein